MSESFRIQYRSKYKSSRKHLKVRMFEEAQAAQGTLDLVDQTKFFLKKRGRKPYKEAAEGSGAVR